MLIDSPSVMYGTFQRCRHASPDSTELLALLNDVLEVVSQQGRFLVEVPDQHIPDKWLKAVRDDTERAITDLRDMEQGRDELSSQNQSLFSLLKEGTRELRRLWAMDAKHAVQSLGYAFHVIPPLLRTPERFNPESYMFCFRMISAFWKDLSLEMREAICKVVGLELGAAEGLIDREGFPLKMAIGNKNNYGVR